MAFRADASSAIGSGHVMRCLTLAEELRRRGATCLFVCAELDGDLVELVRELGFTCRTLPASVAEVAGLDAAATSAALYRDAPLDWLIVDHYGLDAAWERQVAALAVRTMVLDDLADRPHDCDLLLDCTDHPLGAARYEGLLPARTTTWLGLRFALLREEFRRTAAALDRDFTQVRRLLVTFGANDPLDMTSRAVQVLLEQPYQHLDVTVLGGRSNPRADRVRALVDGAPHLRYATASDDMATLMARSDLCIGAGGTTSWERCAVGLPSLVVVLAGNQTEVVRLLDESGAARSLGPGQELGVQMLRSALDDALHDAEWRRRSSRRGRELVDGRGAVRVAEHLAGLAGSEAAR